MVTPIKETPILRGKDARKFVEKVRRNEQEPAPREEYERVIRKHCHIYHCVIYLE